MAIASGTAEAASLLQLDIEKILVLIEKKARVKLPRRVIEISLSDNLLHIRFAHPETREATVEPLPLRTSVSLFRDEETGEPTALEILDINQLLEELHARPRHEPSRGVHRTE